jgi:hypothetical protein
MFKKQPNKKIALREGDLLTVLRAYQQTYPQKLWTMKPILWAGQIPATGH